MANEQRPQKGGVWPVCSRCGKPIIPKGLGTALKPSHEPILVARKPLSGTVAANVLEWGTGAINVDGGRIGTIGDRANEGGGGKGAGYDAHNKPGRKYGAGLGGIVADPHPQGRFPANFIHDGSDEVVRLFPESKADTGSAARFFYCSKASKRDRDEGCEGLEERQIRRNSGGEYAHNSGSTNSSKNGGGSRNSHPTVKPTSLMRYLCRLVTPPGGTVLDPFTGSGSTGKACALEGFEFIGIEREEEYLKIATARIENAKGELFGASV